MSFVLGQSPNASVKDTHISSVANCPSEIQRYLLAFHNFEINLKDINLNQSLTYIYSYIIRTIYTFLNHTYKYDSEYIPIV